MGHADGDLRDLFTVDESADGEKAKHVVVDPGLSSHFFLFKFFSFHFLPTPMFHTSSPVEHLSLTLAVGTVPSLTAAIAHINEHGSHH
jgi:hypothetical protein